MTSRRLFTLLLLLFALTLGAPPGSIAEDEGEKAFKENCSMCHTLDRPRGKHMTRGQWKEMMDRMVGFGAQISRRHREAILD